MGALVDGLSPESRSDLTFLEDAKILFRDSGIYIHSSSDGVITISADAASNAIALSGPSSLTGAVAITGATTITGTTDLTGNITLNGNIVAEADTSLKLPSKDGSNNFAIQDSDAFPIFKVDSKGNVKTKGTVTKI